MGILNKKEKIVRSTVGRNTCVVAFKDKETDQPIKCIREKKETERTKEIVAVTVDEDGKLEEEIEEVHRLDM